MTNMGQDKITFFFSDDEDDGPEVEDNDPAEVRPTTTQTDKPTDSNTVNMRSYDLYITYDRYYQVRLRGLIVVEKLKLSYLL